MDDLVVETKRLAAADPKLLWSVRRYMGARTARGQGRHVDPEKHDLIVTSFAAHWPPAQRPRGGYSEDSPHDAAQYILGSINALGTDASAKAGEVLNRLTTDPAAAPYHEHIRHMRAQQRRTRRDREYISPTFEEIRRTLRGEQPGTIDDLKALTLDTIADVQKYVRDSDTRGWEKFWAAGKPLDEDSCRNRLLDDLRPRLDGVLTLMPESLMPERKRVDILVLHEKKGLPIEIKGQWHAELWDAASTQLEGQYTRDWRAFGRGIYLVFWFGPDCEKMLTAHPNGLPAPESPSECKKMLESRLNPSERARIDIVAFDASPA